MRNPFVPAAAASLLLAGCPGPAPQQSPCKSLVAGDVVITEFMPDPASTDTGREWFELHNPTSADISLSGLTVFTSAADGSKEKTHALPKTLTLPAGGYLALGDVREGAALPPYIGYSYDDALGSLPNGSGAIGVKCGTNVLDKVTWTTAPKSGKSRSLDGKLSPDSAINDTESNFCDGTTETDTDVFGTPGKKNDLCGSGDGGVVGGTCMDAVLAVGRPVVLPEAAGDLVITEFMANPGVVSDTNGEWFELYATKDLDLNGLTLTAGSSSDTVEATGCLRIPAGAYAVIARSEDGGVNGGLPSVTATTKLSLANSNGSLSVANGAVVVDSISWATCADGASTQLDPLKLDATQNDAADAFCASTQAYGAGDKGSPGSANTACVAPPADDTCVDATTGQPRPLMRPAVGDLVISELMPNPAVVSDTSGEWFEVHVKADVDLNGLKLGYDTASPTTLQSQACIHPGPGSWVVFAKNADSAVNGGLPPVTATFGFSLGNSSPHTVKVLFADGGLLDQVAYDTANVKAGISWQLDVNNLDAVSNDAAANFCTSDAGTWTGVDGGDRGTPGAANGRCF
jgi:hypothetical protein